MPAEEKIHPEILIRSTEAMVRLEAAFAEQTKEIAAQHSEERSTWNSAFAKLDNCDRSVQELRFVIEQQEKRLIEQVEEERKDRRAAVKAERMDQKENRNMVIHTAQAIWEKGGQWVVAAVCLYLVLTIRQCSPAGFDLSTIIGGK